MITINNLEPTITRFPDGEMNVSFQPSLIASLDKQVTLDWRFRHNDEIVLLGLIMNLLDTFEQIDELTVNIPFMPYSRMDRHEAGYHNPMSLLVINNILASYKQSVSFKVQYTTEDLHNPKALTEITRLGATPMGLHNKQAMVDHLDEFMAARQVDAQNLLVVFPDKGAQARYGAVIEFLASKTKTPNIAVGQKTRDFESHKITGYELPGDVSDNIEEIVIIDDVISYGGTFIKLIDAIREKTDLPVSIVTSHAEDALWRGDLLAKNVPIYTSHTLNDHYSKPDEKVFFYNEFE